MFAFKSVRKTTLPFCFTDFYRYKQCSAQFDHRSIILMECKKFWHFVLSSPSLKVCYFMFIFNLQRSWSINCFLVRHAATVQDLIIKYMIRKLTNTVFSSSSTFRERWQKNWIRLGWKIWQNIRTKLLFWNIPMVKVRYYS